MLSKLKILLICLLCVNALFAAQYDVLAKTDNTITFQGYLTDSSGKPFFGTITMGFEFYKDESAGTVIIANTTLNRLVQVFNGQYATKLALPVNIMTLLNRNKNIWVQVGIIEEDKEGESSSSLKQLTPRVQLTAAAQALSVRGIYYDNTSKTIKIGQGYRYENLDLDYEGTDLIVSGNVGIGTNDPSTARLVVTGGHMMVTGDMFVSGDIVPAEITTNDDSGVYGAVWN